MSDYKKMYTRLFNKVSDIIEELQQVQRETEEIYIESGDTKIVMLKPDRDEAPENEKREE